MEGRIDRTVLDEALALARGGDVDGAIGLLREARSTRALADGERTLLFQFLGVRALFDEAIEVATEAIAVGGTSTARSNWTLRRGLMLLELGQRDDALADLLAVQKLKANEGHIDQSRAALLRVAQLPRPKKQ